jgi:hypothetical protein
MRNLALRLFGIVFLVCGFAGCSATTPIVSEWRNPGYASAPSVKRVMVGGLGGETSVRRNFEDEFVAQLRGAGVDALPSYRYLPEEEKLDESKLKEAAKKAGADAVIFARSVSVEQKTQYSPSYYPSPWFGVYGSHVGATWHGLYGAPSVYRYKEYTSETTLYDIAKNEVVWTATLKTTEPEDVKAAIKTYVETVVQSLREHKLIAARE